MTHPSAASYLMMVLLALGAAAPATARGEDRLEPARWREDGFGVSIRPPLGATVIHHPPGGELVAFVDADGTRFALTITESSDAVTIDDLKAQAARQMTIPHPSWVPVDDPSPPTELHGLPAGRVLFAVPDKDQGDWVMGFVFVQLDDFVFVTLQMRTAAVSYHDAMKTFDAMAQSIEVMSPAELSAQRERRLQAGQAWLENLTRQRLLAATPPVQLFRVLIADQDVGYLRVTHEPAKELGLDGHHVIVQSHLTTEAGDTDTASQFFESSDGEMELWINTITQRKSPRTLPQGQAAAVDTINLRETGSRDDHGIEVSIDTRTRLSERHEWPVPRIAYLSQFNRMLMGALLPRRGAEMAFYCYSSLVKKLALMTVRVEPIRQGPYRGGYAVIIRPSPSEGEEVMIYDAADRLVEWRPGDGRVLKATTPDELRKIWDNDKR